MIEVVRTSSAAILGHLNQMSAVIPPQVPPEPWPYSPYNPHANWKSNVQKWLAMSKASGRRRDLRSPSQPYELPIRLVSKHQLPAPFEKHSEQSGLPVG